MSESIGGQLVLGLPGEAWTAIGSVVAIGAFLLAVLQILLAPKPPAPRPQPPNPQCPPELFLLHKVIGLTLAEIAAATGAAPSTVRSWLTGRHRPTGNRAHHLAALGAQATALLLTQSAPEAAARLRAAHFEDP